MRRTAVLATLALGACLAPPPDVSPGEPLEPLGRFVVCGQRFPVDAPVVLWFEAPHYNAYDVVPRFSSDGPRGLRYHPGRRTDDAVLAARMADGVDLDELRATVDLFVLHYDVSGTSRACFRTLQDERKLSVHFLLDVDGTLYQTLDLAEQAWHASQANPRSIGIEIANVGAYPPGEDAILARWYTADPFGLRLTIPPERGDGGVRTEDFVGRPVTPVIVEGEVHGGRLRQGDFTTEQYRSLAALTAALSQALPRIRPDAPRDAAGAVRMDVLSEDELDAFSGVVGHHHVSASKVDPGPAFAWERFLAEVRARLEPEIEPYP